MYLDIDELTTVQLSKMLKEIPSAVEASRNFECRKCKHTYNQPWPPLNKLFLHTTNYQSEDDFSSSDSDIFDNYDPFHQLCGGDPLLLQRNNTNKRQYNYRACDDQSNDSNDHSSSSSSPSSYEEEEIYSNSAPNCSGLPFVISSACSLPKIYLSQFQQEQDEDDKQTTSLSQTHAYNMYELHEQRQNRAMRVLICLHSKRNFMEDILGYGITVQRNLRTKKIAKISNSMEYLSFDAFCHEGGRRCLTNEEYEFWLPLCK